MLVLFISFLALPVIQKYKVSNSGVFLQNNFDVLNLSKDAKVNQIYEVSLLQDSVEPESIYLYSGDVIRFINKQDSEVTILINGNQAVVNPSKDYFSIFDTPGVFKVGVNYKRIPKTFSVEVHVK